MGSATLRGSDHAVFAGKLAQMAREVWLRTNRRVLAAQAVLPAIGLLAGVIGLLLMESRLAFWVSASATLFSASLLAWIAWRGKRPRLAYDRGFLEVYLAAGTPTRVPIEIVECFFLGQGPSLLPNVSVGNTGQQLETATLIVRLAESAIDWKHRDVRPSLGQWCEGYITIRGTFCEPLLPELAAQLNRRLVEAHRDRAKS